MLWALIFITLPSVVSIALLVRLILRVRTAHKHIRVLSEEIQEKLNHREGF